MIPEALVQRELAHDHLTELRVVTSMHERKALMAELSDAVIALPGGFGTFEELFETITWSQLGIQRKAIGVLNVGGFYDGCWHWWSTPSRRGSSRRETARWSCAAAEPGALLDLLVGVRAAAARHKWLNRSDTDVERGSAPVALTQITTWFLEMASPDQLAPGRAPRPEARWCASGGRARSSAASSTGRWAANWYWMDRLAWTYAEWQAWVSRWRPGSAYVDGTPAGYFELQTAAGRLGQHRAVRAAAVGDRARGWAAGC